MTRAILCISLILALAIHLSEASSSIVNIFIVVPSSYAGGLTSEQAFPVIQAWTGQSTDPPCGADCRELEGWWRREIDRAFDYQIFIVPIPETISELANGQLDICDTPTPQSLMSPVVQALKRKGYDFSALDQRTFIVLLGGGGWAGHTFLTPRSHSIGTMMVGDWGIMRELGLTPQGCDVSSPDHQFWWYFPSAGYGHEAIGAMGVARIDTDLFMGYTLTQKERNALKTQSREWWIP